MMIEAASQERTICLCHDIEAGLGHRSVDPQFAALTDQRASGYLREMLAIERELGIEATYFVVGTILGDRVGPIREGGHCLGFHSYDHAAERREQQRYRILRWLLHSGLPSDHQLKQCRALDQSIRGYRPPQSFLTSELTASNLRRHGFEWMACASAELEIEEPELRRNVAFIPLEFDDYSLYTGLRDYPAWEQYALSVIARSRFTAFSLHDCYAEHWLNDYPDFLARLKSMGQCVPLADVYSRLHSGSRRDKKWPG